MKEKSKVLLFTLIAIVFAIIGIIGVIITGVNQSVFAEAQGETNYSHVTEGRQFEIVYSEKHSSWNIVIFKCNRTGDYFMYTYYIGYYDHPQAGGLIQIDRYYKEAEEW